MNENHVTQADREEFRALKERQEKAAGKAKDDLPVGAGAYGMLPSMYMKIPY